MYYDVRIFQKDVEGFRVVKAVKGERLTDVLGKNGFLMSAPCGGRGLCGKCTVKIKDDKESEDSIDKDIIGEEKFAEGYRLACLYTVNSNLDVYLEQNTKGQIMTNVILAAYEQDPIVSIDNSDKYYYGVAFDIGTTTVVAYLSNLVNGEITDSMSGINMQAVYGSDVISRITYAIQEHNGLDILKSAICNQIGSMLTKLVQKNGIDITDIKCVSIAGNTVMLHLLQGLDVKGLSAYPYNPVNLGGEVTSILKLDIPLPELAGCPVFILPCISAFAGADITAAILACGMSDSSKLSLLVDIGTNGELALGNKDRIIVCSTAAGPAFEGASIKHGTGGIPGAIDSVKITGGDVKITTIGNYEPVGICGSGIIDAVAELLREGIVDETGKMNIPEYILYRKNNGDNIAITARDIREVQLAKGAIAAGINILIKEMGIDAEEIDRVFIAGGFGNYASKDSMLKIGLLRNEFENKVVGLGNAAGAGAVRVLLSKDSFYHSISIAKKCEYIELTDRKDFQDEFVNSIFFAN